MTKCLTTRELFQALLDGKTITTRDGVVDGVKPEWVLTDYIQNATIDSKLELFKQYIGDLIIKPRTININGFEVPEPCRKPPKVGTTTYYYFDVFNGDKDLVNDCEWEDTDIDGQILKLGLLHLTKEAAIQHAKALLSFTEVK